MQMKIVWQLWLQTTLDFIQASSLKLLPEVPGEVKDYSMNIDVTRREFSQHLTPETRRREDKVEIVSIEISSIVVHFIHYDGACYLS